MAIRSKDFRFFRDNAGYCVGERAVGAIALARAEQSAQERDWEFVWEADDYADSCDDEGCNDYRREKAGYTSDGTFIGPSDPRDNRWYHRLHAHEILICSLRNEDGEYLASLGGIIDPSSEYRRVIEAELASEALADEARAASDLLRFVSAAYGVAVAS